MGRKRETPRPLTRCEFACKKITFYTELVSEPREKAQKTPSPAITDRLADNFLSVFISPSPICLERVGKKRDAPHLAWQQPPKSQRLTNKICR